MDAHKDSMRVALMMLSSKKGSSVRLQNSE